MTEQNTPISTRVADGIEEIATKVREMSVDRAATAITWVAVGLIAAVIAIVAIIWILIGIFRALGALMGMELAYAVVGLVLILVGALVWSRRYPKDQSS